MTGKRGLERERERGGEGGGREGEGGGREGEGEGFYFEVDCRCSNKS
jgi:hypothetical protein